MSQKISKEYCTGSKYIGRNNVTWNGKGTYTYPDGTEYHGEFKDGHFHGKGIVITPEKMRLSGIFINGKCNEYKQIKFPCGLEYTKDDWTYCHNLDRRYQVEKEYGLLPVFGSYETKTKRTNKIPKGYYDSGIGFLKPENSSIYKYTNPEEYVCTVSKEEKEWIMKYCRHNVEREYDFDRNVLLENEKALKTIEKAIFNEDHDCNCCDIRQRQKGHGQF